MSGVAAAAVERADDLPDAPRAALRGLILTLADAKRLLGIRYSDWMLGSPSLETGIAASSMAQDEWGHSRLTYALLADFGDDPKALEHEREAEAYHSPEVLDSPFPAWTTTIAAALLLDTALATQYAALAETRYTPLRNRVQKLLDEEALHFQYAVGWVERLAAAPEARAALAADLERFLPVALRWLGRPGTDAERALLAEGVLDEDSDALRRRFLDRVAPALAVAGIVAEPGLPASGAGWEGWDDARRRGRPGGPDAETLARVRGDRNRAMLLD